jgi:hypothetical protein
LQEIIFAGYENIIHVKRKECRNEKNKSKSIMRNMET